MAIYTKEKLAELNKDNIPKHVAIIPDGNRRWAKKTGKNIIRGHIQGCEAIINTVNAAIELGIQKLTIYGFSTENTKRPLLEVSELLQTIQSYLNRYQKKLVDGGIKISTIGDKTKLPQHFCNVLEKTCQMTKECTNIECILALHYGARDEIIRAIKKMVSQGVSQLESDSITEETFSSYLDMQTADGPDFLIRTSGEMRLSNFLLWQAAYTELYFEPCPWPEFSSEHLFKAVQEYQKRSRRYGGT